LDDRELDIRGIIGPMRRQWRLIVVVFVAVMAAATLGILALKPLYSATTLLMVDTSQKNLLAPTAETLGTSSDSGRVEGEAELAQSETVLLRAIRDGELLNQGTLAAQPDFVSGLLDAVGIRAYVPPTGAELLDQAMTRLGRAISVQRRGLTFLLAVDARSPDPEEAARLANLVARSYIAEQLEGKIDAVLASRDVVQARMMDASRALSRSEDDIDAFIRQNAADIARDTGRTDLADVLSRIETMTAEQQRLANAVAQANGQLQRNDWSDLAASLRSEAVAGLERRRAGLAGAAATASGQQAVDLRAELGRVEDSLRSAALSEIDTLRTQASSTQAGVSQLRTQLRDQAVNTDLSSEGVARLYELQQTARIARNQYDTLLARLNDLDQQAFLQVADSRIVSEALAPRRPSFPNVQLLLALAAIGAAAAGVTAAFLRENLIGGVTSAEQLRDLVKVDTVITVPRQRAAAGGVGIADLVVTAPLSMYAEAIRKVRLAVDQAIGVDQKPRTGRVVLVTSAVPGEGKSTVALSLARAYAHSGVSTLLIDCDLRKPSIHRLLGVEPSEGLLDYLRTADPERSLEPIAVVDRLKNLDVIVGARRSEGATDELVTGPTFKMLIDVAKRSFDIVILDTPPIVPVVDGAYLSRFADAVVMVAQWAETPQTEIKSATTLVASSVRPRVPLLAVLNQSAEGGRKAGRYAYYYAN
jgi:succinoglycan biosynthesis transport protein ExoP